MDQLKNGEPNKPRLVFVFDHLRARSHLFFRWMSTSPELEAIYHPFILANLLGRDARFTQHSRNSEARNKENNQDLLPLYGQDTFESCRLNLEAAVKEAQEKVCLVHV